MSERASESSIQRLRSADRAQRGSARSLATTLLARPDAPTRPWRVLLVEDATSVRRATARALRTAGFEVTAVRGGTEAMAVLPDARPDVLVTDVTMPGMDGLELVATLRLRGVTVPALVVSARDGMADRVAAYDAGANSFVAKPFRLAELLSRVTELALLHARVATAS